MSQEPEKMSKSGLIIFKVILWTGAIYLLAAVVLDWPPADRLNHVQSRLPVIRGYYPTLSWIVLMVPVCFVALLAGLLYDLITGQGRFVRRD